MGIHTVNMYMHEDSAVTLVRAHLMGVRQLGQACCPADDTIRWMHVWHSVCPQGNERGQRALSSYCSMQIEHCKLWSAILQVALWMHSKTTLFLLCSCLQMLPCPLDVSGQQQEESQQQQQKQRGLSSSGPSASSFLLFL